jgi:predicted nucleic acid-binding protein
MDALVTGKLLDTTVLIDLSRGNSTAAEYVDSERTAGTTLFISVISAMELVAGCRNKQEVAKIKKLYTKKRHVQPARVVINKK